MNVNVIIWSTGVSNLVVVGGVQYVSKIPLDSFS